MDIPAVSQICSLIFFPSISMVLILKSIPIVVMKEGVNWSSLNRRRRQDFPTPRNMNGQTISRLTAISDQEQFDQIVVVSV